MIYDDIKKLADSLASEASFRFVSSRYKGRGRPRNSDYTIGKGGLHGKMDAMILDMLR